MSESTRMMLGLAIGIIVMIVLVMKTKIHTFIALLLAGTPYRTDRWNAGSGPDRCCWCDDNRRYYSDKRWIRKYVKEYGYHHRTWSYDGRNPGSIRSGGTACIYIYQSNR